MKKLILSICVLSLVSIGVSQASAAKWAGVKGGINMADFGGSDAPDNTSMRNAFAGGAFFGWGINEQFGIQIEGLYMSKGAKGKDDSGGTPVDATVKLDYIEFPILFAVRFPAGEKLAFDIFAGPTLGFNIKAEYEAGGETQDVKDETESFEFGAAFGGGFYYMLESFSILADVRYGIGATTTQKDFEGQSYDVKNKGIGIMVGVAFPLGSNQ
ncbi:MAG: PorT family protein [Candidatus Krumholzibacteria bacterium]|nr:PorT family protein [Candidatus Krumholzibacteria bacterium]MDH4336577.1 PorT family protein [Candidatus Krumholzibacteria bacterium]MDH5271018.1 PorT family protein [Candidatus Krumholzibacteria bacterium]MDH5627018.1 PorT family protein [Candidatus Krumholzibacteria bacterium]